MFSFAKGKLRAIRRKWRLPRFGLNGSGGRQTDASSKQAAAEGHHIHREDPLDTHSGNCQTPNHQTNITLNKQVAGVVVSTRVPIDSELARGDDTHDTHVGLPYADAPIAALPFDVLRIIFELDVRNSWVVDYEPSVRGCWMRLSHVCATWRFVLLDMPLLWARDVYAFGVAGGTFRALLARARDAPLNLDLSGHRWIHLDEEERPRLTPALPLCARARRLILETDPDSPEEISALLDAVSGRSLPRLEEFFLHVDVPELDLYDEQGAPLDETAIPDKTPTLDGATNLRDLKLWWFYMRPPTSGNLIKLDITLNQNPPEEKPSMDELLHVLSCNRGLVDLNLNTVFRGRSTTMHPSSVVLPFLLDFSVQAETNEPLHIFLNCLLTPSVRRFHVNGDYTHGLVRAPRTPTLLQAALSVCAGSPALLDGALEIEHSTEFSESLQIYLRSSGPRKHSPLGFFYRAHSTGRPTATADAAVAHLSDARIFERARELQISLHGLDADAMRCWKPVIACCIGAETLSSHVKNTADAAAMLELMEEIHGEGLLLPQRRRLDLNNAWTGVRLDDGSGAFQDVCGRAEKLGVALDIYEQFDRRDSYSYDGFD